MKTIAWMLIGMMAFAGTAMALDFGISGTSISIGNYTINETKDITIKDSKELALASAEPALKVTSIECTPYQTNKTGIDGYWHYCVYSFSNGETRPDSFTYTNLTVQELAEEVVNRAEHTAEIIGPRNEIAYKEKLQ